MLFNSFEYFLFLPAVFFLYWFIFNRSLHWQNILLLAASYFFYAWWSPKFLGLLALSTLLDFLYGFSVASPDRRKAKFFLWLSIINNLGILAVFKYYDFFAVQFREAMEMIGLHVSPVILNFALPVGISFYTFHGMSYVFDIYRERQKPVSNFVDYAVFVSFFPLLVAGPIERANHLLPQVQASRKFSYRQAVDGCRLILWGLFKKVVIADTLAHTVDAVFDQPAGYNGISLITATIAFSFQIYGDFSGYSDIALGTAKLFGFELLSNFRFPYFSRDIAEFWRRWHISLSSWFRDYLYIPLGGSRDGKMKAVRNTFIIFIVSGFWHGASWNFITWGFIHACGFLPLLLLDRNRIHVRSVVAEDRILPDLKEIRQMLGTFTFISFAWIFFRMDTMSQSLGFITHMIKSFIDDPRQFLHLPRHSSVFLYILPLLLGDWYMRRNERSVSIFDTRLRHVLYLVILLADLYFLAKIYFGSSQFIYFQF
jgi:D-alanyl-lipoteichoic acid acyltransferase DltB (MBOAT superfamily)